MTAFLTTRRDRPVQIEFAVVEKKAASIAFGSEVSYIIGPPGTGKTHTLAAIAYAYMSEGRSILIAAHTNIAADNAIQKLVESCNKKNLALGEGQAVRFGATDAFKDPIYEKAYIPTIIKHRTGASEKRKEEIKISLKQISEAKVALQKEGEQGLDGWKAQRSQYLARRDFYKNTIAPLQIREQQRSAAIKAQIQQTESKLRNTQREIESVKQTLAQGIQQQIQLKSLAGFHISNANTLEIMFVDTQQMNRIKRLFKGISIEKIYNELAQAKHVIWQDEQHFYDLQSRIQGLHMEQSRLERVANQDFQVYSAIQYQSTLSSSDKQQIAQLQTELAQLEARIVQGDELQKQHSKQREAQERFYKNEFKKLEEEQTSIEREMQDIEKKIVAEAQVIATTLSKVYMNPALSERKFDVVIMDEVSMAPLPATYIVACHANQSVIALGDPQQLPPIVQAKTEAAQEWLGKSLFGLNFITLTNAASSGYGNSAVLKHQSRMHPEIAMIASKHVYKNELYDSPRVLDRHPDYANVEPLQGKHSLLCDTSDAAPIATKPEGGSCINIYNALCTMAIAKQVLCTLPPLEHRSDTRRIGIVTPYKKQAELFERLVADAGLKDYIHPGTVHRFQGLEYDVIIFDTVDSGFTKPREGFIKGGYDSDAMRLINVAITRAKYKLIIVANSAYVRREFAETDTLRLAVEEAKRNTIFSNTILKGSLFTLPDAQQKTQGHANTQTNNGNAETQQFRLPLEANTFYKELQALNQQNFFPAFEQDVKAAREEILIFSPFLAVHRTSLLLPLLQTKHMTGVKIRVVTKPFDEDSVRGREEAEQLLKDANIDIQYKGGVHEKVAIIDKQIVYSGSLNILSHSSTSEFMIRLSSQKFAEVVESLIGLSNSSKSYKNKEKDVERRSDDIVVYLREFPKLKGACGHEITAKTGTNGSFYGCVNWKICTHKEKNKDITEEHLTSISRLTTISCTECSSKTPMALKVNRRDIWLECSNTMSCGYKRNIIITQN